MAVVLLFYLSPVQFAYADYWDVEDKFRLVQEAFCQKDINNINTVKQHLSSMVELDQDVRKISINAKVLNLIKRIDSFNTAHLKSILAIHGWINISKFGKEADYQAWLLVQHAALEIAFQEQCLSMLEKLLPLKETNPTNFAYLFDRVAINKGKKQRYGTQFKIEEGRIELLPYEGTLEDLNERRRRIGLESVEKYLDRGKEVFKLKNHS